MQAPLQVTFRNMSGEDDHIALINEKAEELMKLHDRIVGIDVSVAAPHRHHRKGRMYEVQVSLRIPGQTIVANRHPSAQKAHESMDRAISDAFKAARRELVAWLDRREDRLRS